MNSVCGLSEANGYIYILTNVDRFVRFREHRPTKGNTVEIVTDTLVGRVITNIGFLQTITTVCRWYFETDLSHSPIKLLCEKLFRTTVYHSPDNGMVESFHQHFD